MDSSKNLVVKSNSLIEARYKLSLEEQRLILMLVSLINYNDTDFKVYEVNIKDFADLTGVSGKSIYKQAINLCQTVMFRNLKMETEKSILTLNWLSSAEYFKGEGRMELSVDPKLKPYLLSLKENFTSYQLDNVVSLKSFFSIRMYELLKQYEKLNHRIISIDKLRGYLSIENNQYHRYSNFKQKVILPAQKELKEKCDIWFDFEEIKEGRKVAKIKFNIHKNVEEEEEKVIKPKVKVVKPIKPKIENPLHMEFIEKLKEVIEEKLPLADLKAIGEASNYDIDVAINAYRFTKQQNTVSSLTGYVIWACKRPVEKSSPVSIRKPIEQEPNKTTWDFELLQLVERASLMQGAGMEVDEDLMAKIRARREKS